MLKDPDRERIATISNKTNEIITKNSRFLKRQHALIRRFGEDFYLPPKGAERYSSKMKPLAPKDNDIGKEPGE